VYQGNLALAELVDDAQEHRGILGDVHVTGDQAHADEVTAGGEGAAPGEAGSIAVRQNFGVGKASYFYNPFCYIGFL